MLWKELSDAFLSIFSCYSVDLKDKLPTNFHLPANYLLCIFRDSPFIFFYSTPPFCCSLQGFPSECHLQRSLGSHCSGPFSAPNFLQTLCDFQKTAPHFEQCLFLKASSLRKFLECDAGKSRHRPWICLDLIPHSVTVFPLLSPPTSSSRIVLMAKRDSICLTS